MSRKLYALFVLIGAIGSLILVYLYFFIYYTSTLLINSNVSGYSVELFSKTTAQKWIYECPEQQCIITEVSPFDYNISISKENYKTNIISAKISARKTEKFVIEMEKQTNLKVFKEDIIKETAQQRIQRLREKNKYYASFRIDTGVKINFIQKQDQLEMEYQNIGSTKIISRFPLALPEDIYAEYIDEEGKNIFLKIGKNYYIFSLEGGSIYTLPYEIPIRYIKSGKMSFQYLVVTEKGTFLYNSLTKKSEFQYLFKDFIYQDDALIGIVYQDEEQKKYNFNLIGKGNLIIKYTQDDKERKILLNTDLNIDRVQWKEGKIIFSAAGSEYELENY